MLYSIESGKAISTIPHQPDYLRWRSRLDQVDPAAYRNIHDELDRRFDSREVDTSSWIPGSDWTGTVFDPIYRACDEDSSISGLFFGLLVWQVVLDRDDWWSFGRYEKNGVPIQGITYFRIDPPR